MASNLSSSTLTANLEVTPLTIWDRSVNKAYGVTFFKNLSTSAGDVQLTVTGLPSTINVIVLNPGDVIALRLGGDITKVVAVAVSTATMNFGPQTDGTVMPIYNNLSANG